MAAPTGSSAIDVHQHLWPELLVDRLRARSRAPYLRGWTLHTAAEPAFVVDPTHHDVATRIAADRRDGVGTACVSLSAPLGIESLGIESMGIDGLGRSEAASLVDAWHEGARALPAHFRAWASVTMVDPDLDELAGLLSTDYGDYGEGGEPGKGGKGGFIGVQVPATDLLSPAAWERAGAVLRVAEDAGKPVFVHPGPEVVRPLAGKTPDWWAPVVGYVNQLHAAWWGWQAVRGRELFPSLRLLFAAGAGLAPVHHERQVTRGGEPQKIDPDVFVDTSSYGPQALDALVRVLGIDVLALGSDRPYAEPVDRLFGDAATHAIRVANPGRLLDGRPAADHVRQEGRPWPRAS